MSLTDFLIAHPVDNVTKQVPVSKRLKDENGELYKFTIKPMLQDEYLAYQDACTNLDSKGKIKFNTKKFNQLLVINHTVDPDFRNAEFIKQLGCVKPEQAMNKVLLSGEIQTLAEQIRIVSGFADSLDDLVEEVKN